jgi:signal transduction histidine kinase
MTIPVPLADDHPIVRTGKRGESTRCTTPSSSGSRAHRVVTAPLFATAESASPSSTPRAQLGNTASAHVDISRLPSKRGRTLSRMPSEGKGRNGTTPMRVSGPAGTTRELAQISKSLGDVARDEFVMLVHDLRNPLATVNMCTQLLLRDAHSDNLHEGLRNIQEAALRLEGLIDELAALRKPHRAFGAMPSPDPSDAVELVRRIGRGAKRARVSSQESEIVGYWNVVELERLVANLIDNALKYSPLGQPVDVTVSRADGCVVITVSDQGIGIPSMDVPRVFDRGYRATNAKATFTGDGLGLATVRRIVDALHGTITVASEEGVGTSVTVRLPSAKDAENSPRTLGTKGLPS